IKVAAATAIGVAVSIRTMRAASTRLIVTAACASILCAAVAGSHAIARIELSSVLLLGTSAHLLGAALWLGGLPCFWLALRDAEPALASRIARRFSAVAMTGVALIVIGVIAFATMYIGSIGAVYGTAYGAMATTKGLLFALLL